MVAVSLRQEAVAHKGAQAHQKYNFARQDAFQPIYVRYDLSSESLAEYELSTPERFTTANDKNKVFWPQST